MYVYCYVPPRVDAALAKNLRYRSIPISGERGLPDASLGRRWVSAGGAGRGGWLNKGDPAQEWRSSGARLSGLHSGSPVRVFGRGDGNQRPLLV